MLHYDDTYAECITQNRKWMNLILDGSILDILTSVNETFWKLLSKISAEACKPLGNSEKLKQNSMSAQSLKSTDFWQVPEKMAEVSAFFF